jgi:hypothetical protein
MGWTLAFCYVLYPHDSLVLKRTLALKKETPRTALFCLSCVEIPCGKVVKSAQSIGVLIIDSPASHKYAFANGQLFLLFPMQECRKAALSKLYAFPRLGVRMHAKEIPWLLILKLKEL